jgi:HK97 family phage major capsid protein
MPATISNQDHPLVVERAALLAEAAAVIRQASRENREPNEQEDEKIVSNLKRAEELKNEFLSTRLTRPANIGNVSWGARGRSGGTCFRDVSTGQLVRTLAPGDTLAEDNGDGDFAIGRFLQAKLTGQDSPILAGVATTTDIESGGSLLSPIYSKRMVDLARANSVCIKAGAETMPMEAPEMTIARVTADATSYWRPEGSSVTASKMTFDRVILRAKTLAAIVPVTIELMEDVQNFPQIVESSLAAAMGQKLDYACLSGAGAASEPKGIYNYTTVNSVTSVATPTNYNEVSSAVSEILQDNFPGDPSELAWVQHPRDAETYDQLADTTNQPLRPTPWVEKLRRFYTTGIDDSLGGSGNESWAIVGDFRQMLIGLRTSGVVVRIINAGSATDADSVTHNAVSELKAFIVCHLRADMALLRPTWFTKLTGILA